MPSVQTLINDVASLSLAGDSPDSVETALILSWLQSTYNEVYGEVAANYPTKLETTQNVTMTSGVGTLSPEPFDIKSVVDTTNKNILDVTTAADVEADDLELDNTGNAYLYYVSSGTTITSYPKSSFTARVRYIPMPATFTTSSAESDVAFPPMFHDILKWGALRYAAYDERDKGFNFEIQVAETMFKKRKNDLLEWVHNTSPKPRVRVKAVLA